MGYTSVVDWKYLQMKQANVQSFLRYRTTSNQKRWDEIFNDMFLPILHCYNASNNKEGYFSVLIKTNRKDRLGRWIWSTQFAIDFPVKKIKCWKADQIQRLKGNFQQGMGHDGEVVRRNYERSGYRYKQLALINFLDVPHSELNS